MSGSFLFDRAAQKAFKAFEDQLLASEPPNFVENRRIFQSLYEEAIRLGVLPPKDPLEGIDVDIRIAEALRLV